MTTQHIHVENQRTVQLEGYVADCAQGWAILDSAGTAIQYYFTSVLFYLHSTKS